MDAWLGDAKPRCDSSQGLSSKQMDQVRRLTSSFEGKNKISTNNWNPLVQHGM